MVDYCDKQELASWRSEAAAGHYWVLEAQARRVWYPPVLSLTRCMQARNKGRRDQRRLSLSPVVLFTHQVRGSLAAYSPEREREREDGCCVLRPSLCVAEPTEYPVHCAPAVRGGWCPRSTGVRVQYIYTRGFAAR
jgi:hypothetical protein